MSTQTERPATESTDRTRRPYQFALSPSRLGDFKQCPLRFRFKVIDRITMPAKVAVSRGILVHTVLEDLFGLPAAERTVENAIGMLDGAWERVLASENGRHRSLFDVGGDAEGTTLDQWFGMAANLLRTYFEYEDPTRLEPAAREWRIRHQLADGGPTISGMVDRLDVNEQNWTRVVDYKTGKKPAPAYREDTAFKMWFYALMVWRETGNLPKQLKLL
jgi:putative RecB family exonuclease